MSRPFAAMPAFRWLGAKLAVRPRAAFPACAAACAGWLLVLNQSACGGDDPPQPRDAGTVSQSQPATATAGTAGRANQTNRTNDEDVASPALEPLLACGQSECMRPKNVAAQLLMGITGLPMTGAETVACCLDEAAGTCSAAASNGSSCDTVAVSDNRCPGVDLSALSNLVGGLGDSAMEAMIGCCTHDMCGLDGKLFGRGCVENAEAKRMLSAVPVIGPLISVPPPRACVAPSHVDNDKPDAGVKPDAGKPAANEEDAG